MSLATPTAFAANPSRVWQFYHYRREKYCNWTLFAHKFYLLTDLSRALKAVPNAAHLALAMLSIPEHLKVVAPSAKFTLVTQNVDGLSARAFRDVCPTEEPALLEMHGRLFETICTVCDDRVINFDSPICPALAGTEELVERHEQEPVIPLQDLPHFRKHNCGGLLQPGVVWFNEIPHHLEEINKIVGQADLALVVGTSSMVRHILLWHPPYVHRSCRYTQRLDMLRKWPSTAAQSPCLIYSIVRVMKMRTFYFLGHARRLFPLCYLEQVRSQASSLALCSSSPCLAEQTVSFVKVRPCRVILL